MRLTPALSPRGLLSLVHDDAAPELDDTVAARLVDAFAQDAGRALLHLGGSEVGTALSAALSYWRGFATRYVAALCLLPPADADAAASRSTLPPPIPPPSPAELDTLVLGVPPMPGAEYVTAEILATFWTEIGKAFAGTMAGGERSLGEALHALHPAWNLVGRVHFNLAENRNDDEAPFAFLATYTHQLSARGKAQHLPLGEALREYAGARNRERLLSLLLPVQRAAERCEWLREMVEANDVFHPLRWTPADAYRLLCDVPVLEQAGVIVRMPAAWNAARPARPLVSVTVGTRKPGGVGVDALMDFNMALTLDGETLSKSELKQLLAGSRRLVLMRGRWVEVDAEALSATLEHFEAAAKTAAEQQLTFAEAVRLLAGTGLDGGESIPVETSPWSRVTAGPWLAGVLGELRSPDGLARVEPGTELCGTLRPYQSVGVRWLHLLSSLGLGACLADDMGLGKTIQLLSLLLVRRREARRDAPRRPTLLVAPASLLANWQSETERFAPSLRALVVHPSAMPAAAMRVLNESAWEQHDLVITTYGTLLRVPALVDAEWDVVVLDEAQAIKNPGARQTRVVKTLRARARIALTGTPVENRLADLWSIFDFINPGLLGSAKEFTRYSKSIAKRPTNPYGPLRQLVRPYVLRRLKTDRTVINDLPEKTELKAYCQLSRVQAALYKDTVGELQEQIRAVDGIRRRGLVLKYLMRLKQICNHPSHWLGDGEWRAKDSGKFARLAELGDVIAAKQEKVLVFTQFRETIPPLAAFLGGVFGRPGVTLSGDTAVKERAALVKRFQGDDTVPFFVVSLKAGGSGLNLTAASHVIHFDRWWNPAVENQATDRAFRIGQTKNVLVHKFICRGTMEEKIDALIDSKAGLSAELLGGGEEIGLTEMTDAELLRLVALDINTPMEE